MEMWKDTPGYEGLYQVSDLGRVKSLERYVQNHSGTRYLVPERMKKPSEKRERRKEKGYLVVSLYKDNKGTNFYVHRLVADAFVPNPDGKQTVNHKDGNKHNNKAENLEWSTHAENNDHAYRTGLNDSSHRRNNRSSIAVLQYDQNMNLLHKYPSIREAQRQTGVDCEAIRQGIKHGWKYGGFIWKKAN